MHSQYKENQLTNPALAQQHLRIVDTVIHTLEAYVDWVPMNFIAGQKLGGIICQLVGIPEVRMVSLHRHDLICSALGIDLVGCCAGGS
jgi:hypothetical protein